MNARPLAARHWLRPFSLQWRCKPVLAQMHRRPPHLVLSVVTLIVALVNGWPVALQAAGQLTGCGGAQVAATNADFEAQVAELTNVRRAAAGLPPLKVVTELNNAARYHAADMQQDDYFKHHSHDQIDGKAVQVCEWHQRVMLYYPSPSAENIAWGYTTPEAVVQAWMDSEGHRKNILSDARELGVGFFENEWVQDFGTRNTVYPLIINGEARQTATPQITLYVYGAWAQMRLRDNGAAWSDWQPFQNGSTWQVAHTQGVHTVEVELQKGAQTLISSDTIELTTNGDTPVTPTPTPLPPATPQPDPNIGLNNHLFLPVVQR
ncbi:MAG: CAP domain-containing protein [Chloroflexota bacterium]|nr:CAP domain-containing protein [Chloroflexota bacterium]